MKEKLGLSDTSLTGVWTGRRREYFNRGHQFGFIPLPRYCMSFTAGKRRNDEVHRQLENTDPALTWTRRLENN